MIFNYSISILFVIIIIQLAESPNLRPIHQFTVHMKVKLELYDESLAQIRKLYYPGVYETNLYTPLRFDEGFLVIGDVIYNKRLIYPDSSVLLNRFVHYYMPRPGLQLVNITSYYLDQKHYYENIEFIRDFYEIAGPNTEPGTEGQRYRENIHKLISVDISDLNALTLVLETRYRENKLEIFVSDIFRPFVKLGCIKYKNFIIDNHVTNNHYRSLTCEFDEDMIKVNVLTLLNNSKRTDLRYIVNTQATTQDECVKKESSRVFIITRLP